MFMCHRLLVTIIQMLVMDRSNWFIRDIVKLERELDGKNH